MKKLAVFDWNGTLIDDAEANWEGCNLCLSVFGKGPITFEQYRETMDFPVLHLYARNGIDPDTYLANFQTAASAFLDNYKKLAVTAPLRRGTTDLLDWLLDNGYDLMVLSNFLQAELEAQIADRHIMHYFKHVSGNLAFNEIEHSRTTKRERLERLMSENGYSPADALIVGDSLEEPEISRHFGMKAFSVTWGCIAPHRIKAAGTDYLIDELAEIAEILQKRQA